MTCENEQGRQTNCVYQINSKFQGVKPLCGLNKNFSPLWPKILDWPYCILGLFWKTMYGRLHKTFVVATP